MTCIESIEPRSGSYTEPWMEVRFKCWLAANNAISEEQVVAFGEEVCGATGLDVAKLPKRWAAGKIAKSSTIGRIDGAFPGSGHVYFLPLWRLLSGKPLSEVAINKLMFDYASADPEMWLFPTISDGTKRSLVYKDDSNGLSDRGDVHGMMGILALMRVAESRKEFEPYGRHLMNLVRCLPWAAREEWLAANFGAFCRLIQSLHLVQPLTRQRFNVDWRIVHRQFKKRSEYKPRDFRATGKDGRFIEYADPIIYHDTSSTWQSVDFD